MDRLILTQIPISELKQIIKEAIMEILKENKLISDSDDFYKIMTLDEASNFLQLAKPTIYAKTSKRVIPFHKVGKKLYFKKADLLQWVESHRKKTVSEIKQEFD